ncbi:MAG: hypothetical protein H0W50_01870 [Parachlamydiaceae bacterium]|nr:hypothetical protein [Parachlamydiaceae bacterium]
MELKQWEKHYDKVIENQIDLYMKEKGNELVMPDPLRSKEFQLSGYRDQLAQLIHSKTADDVINQALSLICNQMPQAVAKEVWDSVSEEFCHCEENISRYLEADAQKERSNQPHQESDPIISEDIYTPIYEMCGLSLETLNHCYAFGQSLYKNEPDNSKFVMLFLMKIAPQICEFWVSAAMCDKQMGRYQAAIEIYKLAEIAFPDIPSLYLYCADNYIADGDITSAKIQLEAAKNVLSQSTETTAQWQKTYEFLLSKTS